MRLKICKKCNKSKAEKFKRSLAKYIDKKELKNVSISLSSCLGECKSLTIQFADQKKISGVKLKDVKKVAKLLA